MAKKQNGNGTGNKGPHKIIVPNDLFDRIAKLYPNTRVGFTAIRLLERIIAIEGMEEEIEKRRIENREYGECIDEEDENENENEEEDENECVEDEEEEEPKSVKPLRRKKSELPKRRKGLTPDSIEIYKLMKKDGLELIDVGGIEECTKDNDCPIETLIRKSNRLRPIKNLKKGDEIVLCEFRRRKNKSFHAAVTLKYSENMWNIFENT